MKDRVRLIVSTMIKEYATLSDDKKLSMLRVARFQGKDYEEQLKRRGEKVPWIIRNKPAYDSTRLFIRYVTIYKL